MIVSIVGRSSIGGIGSVLRSGRGFLILLLPVSLDLPSFFSDRSNQDGAGSSVLGRLEFRREHVEDGRSRRMGVHERVFRLQPRQIGTFRPPQRLANAMVHGLRRALSDLLDDDEAIDDHDQIYISLSTGRLDNAFDYRGLTVTEWQQNEVRAAEMLDHMACILNSKEQFEMNESFQLACVHVRRPPGRRTVCLGISPRNISRE